MLFSYRCPPPSILPPPVVDHKKNIHSSLSLVLSFFFLSSIFTLQRWTDRCKICEQKIRKKKISHARARTAPTHQRLEQRNKKESGPERGEKPSAPTQQRPGGKGRGTRKARECRENLSLSLSLCPLETHTSTQSHEFVCARMAEGASIDLLFALK